MKLIKSFLVNFEKFRDQFVPHEVIKNCNIDIIYRFRLVAETTIIAMVVVTIFTVFYPILTHFSWPASIFSTTFGVILLSMHTFLLIHLKKQKTHQATAHYMIASAFMAICVGITLTGGLFNNITPAFFPLPIVMAFLLIGKPAGLAYSTLTFLVFSIFAVMSLSGFHFPQTIPANNSNAVQILLWIFFAITMLGLVLAYDGLSINLIKQLKLEQDKQTYLATHDALTGLANRQKFDERINEAIHRSQRMGNRVTLLVIDLNQFKPINDSFGHDAGDAILVHVANQLSATIRADDLAARIGGDEFAIILQGDNNIKDITALLSRLSRQVSLPLRYKNKILTVTGSIGIASYPDQTKTEEDLRKAADTAMYTAKKKGKEWFFFNETLDS